MAYDYGSDSLNIKNPFRTEGWIFLARGAVIAALGVAGIFAARASADAANSDLAIVQLGASLLFLLSGVAAITSGLLKVLRFFVGRNVPSSLARNLAPSEVHNQETTKRSQHGTTNPLFYERAQLKEMLVGRKNITFLEPESALERLLYSFFYNLLFLPYGIRNALHRLYRAAALSALWVFATLLVFVVDFVGLVKSFDEPVDKYVGWIAAAFLMVVWYGAIPSRRIEPRLHRVDLGLASLPVLLTLLLALIAPLALGFLKNSGVTLPAIALTPWPVVALILTVGTLSTAVAFYLAKLRVSAAHPLTEVSEFREHWQENLHPQDLFRALDMELADHRFKEVPNRVYIDLQPSLGMEGSNNKGAFLGDTLIETQPIAVDEEVPVPFPQLRVAVSVLGNTLQITGAVWMFMLTVGAELANSDLVGVLEPVVLWAFGVLLTRTAHVYWAEMRFRSFIVHFFGEGTYTESKISSGMSIYDSNRSENTVVRSNFTPWLLASRLVSSTFATSGTENLEGPRVILELSKADDFRDSLVRGLRRFIEGRQVIAAPGSVHDMGNVAGLHRMNEATRAKAPLPGASAGPAVEGGAARIRDESSGPDSGVN